jgi:outer membrane receptor protein involved in Fe transport
VRRLVQWLPKPRVALDLTAAFTRRDSPTRDTAGDRIPGAPESVVSAGVTVERSTSLVNARVGYAVTKRIRAYLDVFNLFDRKANDIDYFYASRLAGEPATGVDDVHFHPGRAPGASGDARGDVLSRCALTPATGCKERAEVQR